jgi:hypothetical protein
MATLVSIFSRYAGFNPGCLPKLNARLLLLEVDVVNIKMQIKQSDSHLRVYSNSPDILHEHQTGESDYQLQENCAYCAPHTPIHPYASPVLTYDSVIVFQT